MNQATLLCEPYWKTKWAYALLSVSFLWVWGGGDFSQLPLRALITGVVFFGLLFKDFKDQKTQLLDIPSLRKALYISLALGLVSGILFHFAKTATPGPILGGGPLGWIQRLGQDFSTLSHLVSTLAMVPLVASWAMISRNLLQKEWGLSGIAFLDALSIGLGAQSAGLFAFVFLFGCLWGYLFEKVSFALAFWTQIFTFSFFIISSWIFS